MTTTKKILLGILALIIVIVAVMFFVPFFSGSSDTDGAPAPSVADTPSATPTPTPVDNSQVSENLAVPDSMQTVINDNQANLYNDTDGNLAPSYPSDLIPLYRVNGVGDSNDITTQNGNPGWTAVYASDATTEEVSAFYQTLLASTENYASDVNEGGATHITGTVDGCNVSITVSGNNPERTGLSAASNVNIFIERVQ